MKNINVVIIIKWVSHYRYDFYNKLKDNLLKENINLILVYGEPIFFQDFSRRDWVNVPWGKKIKNYQINFFNFKFIFQPVFKEIIIADLIIVEQANKLLLNYILLLLCFFKLKKIAFWGHGKNFQNRNIDSFSEKFKRFIANKAFWWFAYNDLSKNYLSNLGFPPDKITSVNNTINTNKVIFEFQNFNNSKLVEFQEKYNISSSTVGIFCGGLISDKRLDFLFESCKIIKSKIPHFELIIIGSGELVNYVIDLSLNYSWVHYLGPLFDNDKICAFKSSKVYLNPGLIGLGIFDAFSMNLPIVTTNFKYHSPEIDYLIHNYNCVITDNNIDSFATGVVNILTDSTLRTNLIYGGILSANYYSINKMALNFTNGIQKSLNI